jgi:hypothetical protein
MVKPLGSGLCPAELVGELAGSSAATGATLLEIVHRWPLCGKFPYIHIDYYHLSAWINQLYGEKQFTVWPARARRMSACTPTPVIRGRVPLINDIGERGPGEASPSMPERDPVSPSWSRPGRITLFMCPSGSLAHGDERFTTSMSVAFDLLNDGQLPALPQGRLVLPQRRKQWVAKAVAGDRVMRPWPVHYARS